MQSLLIVLALLSLAQATTSASSNSGSRTTMSSIVLNTTLTPYSTTSGLLVLDTRSGILPWVDPSTPEDRQSYVTSRGETWDLVMSDEFNDVNRNFSAGGDYLWTSLEKPDGVNGALELYSHNLTTVECEIDDSTGEETCYFQIKVIDEVNNITVYNQYLRPPAYQNTSFFYRAGMLQSWNKFCFQGGMLEVRVQLPGAVGEKAQNPDIINHTSSYPATTGAYYPTWPGIWLMGNLGRAIFSGSTQRMWPFSYNECDERVFNSSNQRISACDPNPGSGMNPYQGRGAPEIDLLEGGGVAISSSIQIGPGMPMKYRRITVNKTLEPDGNTICFYSNYCTTPGSNSPNVPTALYKKRKYQTWYSGLRYAANHFCEPIANATQSYATIKKSLNKGITANECTVDTCPYSFDVQSDLGFIDGDESKGRWGINTKGTCFPVMNAYMGSFLCDPDNQNELCVEPRNDSTPATHVMEPFAYQMDALSANWKIHVGAYTSFTTYQIEWVTGDEGYLRWMIGGYPIYEIPAETVINPGQDASKSNPQRIFPEEPMYIIFNVALSSQWGAYPPNAGKECRGDGKNEQSNRICDSFPMYMKIDYIRLYQDRSSTSTMATTCDPPSHPTAQWIIDHIDEYTDDDNQAIKIFGGAPCRDYTDCTIPWTTEHQFRTGTCNSDFKCECANQYWGGPRCTFQIEETSATGTTVDTNFGPPLYAAVTVGGVAMTLTLIVLVVFSVRRRNKLAAMHEREEKLRARKDLVDDMYGAKVTALTPDYDDVEITKSGSYNHHYY